MIQKKMLIILLVLLTSKKINTKVCGLVEVFRDEQQLSNQNFIGEEIDLQILTNGKEISVFGWFKLTQILQKKYSFMQLQTYQKNLSNQVSDYQNMLVLSYNNINQNKTYFEIKYAQSENILQSAQYDFQLKKNQWIFIAYTVNYNKNKLKLYFDTYEIKQNQNKVLNYEINYPSFYIRQFLKMDIGCFTQNQKILNNQVQCVEGYSKNFNLILQYFDNPQYLLYMNYHKHKFIEYIFDLNTNMQKQQFLYPIEGSKKPLQINGNLQFEDKQFVIKGTTSFEMFNAIELTQSNEVDSPSIFMTFKYKEPLNDQFLLLKLTSIYNNDIELVFNFVKQQNQQGRFVQLMIPKFNIKFISRKQFKENELNHLKISLVQEFEQFWVIINDVSSDKHVIKGVHDFNLQIFENKQEYNGQFKVIQFTLLDSASGFFNQYLQQDQKQECRMQCNTFGNLNYDLMQCLKCDNNSVLNPINSQCENYCDITKKNEGGICVNCQDQNCSEIQQKFFDITKQGDQFIIKILENFNRHDFKNNKNFFDVNIQGLQRNDYQYSTKISSEYPDGNTINLDLKILNPKYKDKDFDITLQLKKDEVFYSTMRNQLPFQIVEFERFSQDSKPKNEWFERTIIPSKSQKQLQNIKPQRQYTETDFENELTFEQKFKKKFFNPNKLQEQASSTVINEQVNQSNNLTTEEIQNKYNKAYPISQKEIETKQNQNQEESKQINEHHQKHKNHKSVLTTNDIINKDVAKFLFVLFIIAICVGILGQLFKYKQDDFLFQKYIQMILVFQYISFLALYNNQLPETLKSFLGPLISNFLSAQKIFDKPLKEKNSQNHNFFLDYQTFTHRKFKEHEISQHFIINSGLIFLIHVCILGLLIIVSILYKCKKKKRNNVEPNMFVSALKMIKDVIANKLLSTMFLVFIIEITIFTLYNFEHNGFHHPTFQFSLFLAFIYFLLTIFCLMHITCHPRYPRYDDRNQQVNYPEGYEFVYQGLVNKGSGKLFQGFQYLHYFIFSLLVIMAHHKSKVQVVFQFFILVVFSFYVLYKQPAKNEFWQFEQSFHQIIILLLFFFFMIVVLDSNSNRFSFLAKDIIGDFVSYLMTVILTWNSFIVIFCSLRNFYYKTCGKKKDTYDSVGSLPKSMELKNNKPKKEKLKNTIILEESNEDDSQLIDVDEEEKAKKLNQTSL